MKNPGWLGGVKVEPPKNRKFHRPPFCLYPRWGGDFGVWGRGPPLWPRKPFLLRVGFFCLVKRGKKRFLEIRNPRALFKKGEIFWGRWGKKTQRLERGFFLWIETDLVAVSSLFSRFGLTPRGLKILLESDA